MSNTMIGFSPAPEVMVKDPWRVIATEAGRYARGPSALLHLYEGPRSVRTRMTHLGIEDDLAGCARSFAFTAGLHPDNFIQPLQDLIQAIVVALQDHDEQVKQARAARAQQAATKSPSSGGIPMIARFKVQPDGVWYDDGQNPLVWVYSELKIIGGSRDEHHDHHGHALEFRDRYGYPQRWAMPLEMLEDRREYRKVLRRLGLQMNSSKQGIELLQAYLDLWQAQDAMICVERTGWYHGMYILPDATFGQAPNQEKVVLQGLSHTVEGYRQAGTLAEWQAKVAALCVGNSRLLFAVSMAFASAVLALLDMEGGGVHLRGQSSEGKTTALLVAASVWGEPGRLEHWRATTNALEGVASYHNDNLLLLDELKEIDPREAGGVAYMLANGSGKRRGRPEGGTRPRLTWRTLFLSSGEISLETHVEHAGQRVHAGMDVRLTDLPADAGNGIGVFEHLHGHANGQVFADCLRRHVHEAYGTAGRAFLEFLVKDIPYASEQVRKLCDVFVVRCVTATAPGQVRRVAMRFAVIGAAGELATDFGLTEWTAGDALEASARCFEAWVHQRGGLTNADEDRALAHVRLFFERYGIARFLPWDTSASLTSAPCPRCAGTGAYIGGTCFACQGTGASGGTSTNGAMRVYDRAGFRRDTKDGRTEYFVLAEVFRKELSQGYDPVWLGKLLISRGLLEPDTKGRATQNARLPGMGQTRVYHFLPDIMGSV